MTSLYRLVDVTQSYGDRMILNIKEMNIEQGIIMGITGPNGSGKSTLLRILSFLEKPRTGKVFFKGKVVHDINEGLRREATLLLQESRLLKRSVFDNIAYGLRTRGLLDNIPKRVHKALSQVGLDPGQFAERAWFELSGGEAQRVALASRIILDPEVLLLDEPTASIDNRSSEIISKAILEARKNLGTTVIIVSHDLDWAYSASDEIISMHSGFVHSRGPENILHGPWEACGARMVCRKLDDGQQITAPCSSSHPEKALLRPEDIILSKGIPENISARNSITGKIIRMNLENGLGNVLVTVLAGGQTFTSRITSDSLARLELMPGSPVTLLFKATAVRWL